MQAEARDRRAADAAARLGAERDGAVRASVAPAHLAKVVSEAERACAALAASRARLDAAVQAAVPTSAAAARAREAAGRADAAQVRLAGEAGALAEVLAADAGAWPPVLDGLRVTPGLEAALGAALGEGLAASVDVAAPRHWRDLL